ncbi:GGDEF domain-containing protein [Glacieibacterium megasporae]|uniref:GGDEF domain-containing protein n=1 Tax=Glacieibacterium megasporae TaxID=2835787 RepID=UPI001C1E8C3E|nr:GGDEF domain-containing protein [Polymorphobacter megasporae]UAJ10639.1 GGDEF domain-containing protein [Polymorphobacter megasporae]
MSILETRLPDDTYIDLVRSLFLTFVPTIIMAISFLTIGALVASQSRDMFVASLVALGSLAALGRITVLLRYRRRVADACLTIEIARSLERRFGVVYLIFAAVFGAFCATALLAGAVSSNASIIGLLFGYGAGVAAGVSLRPWISIPSLLLATVPPTLVLWSMPDHMHLALGSLTALFVAGAIQTMSERFRKTASDITMRRSFSLLARRDHLTGLSNRLSLRERYEEFAQAAGAADIIAVHCLDLDRFKPVNDRYGHPVGDALLTAVAERLLGTIRECDFAARIGGDEFVIVQTEAKSADEVRALATRIVAAIAEPFFIAGHTIRIATSVGFVLSSTHGSDLTRLVAGADQALCAVKARGGGIEQCVEISDDRILDAEVRIAA